MTNQPLVVAGVDTHKDTHYAAVITVTGAHIGAAEFPATDAGYRALTVSSPATERCCVLVSREPTLTGQA